MFKELEILAAQAGYRFAEAVKDGDKWSNRKPCASVEPV